MSPPEPIVRRWHDLVRESIALRERMLTLDGPLAAACVGIVHSIDAGGKLLIFGNGGSACDAEHVAGEFVGRFKLERRGWPAIALSSNTAAMTAIANDYEYDEVFARQVQAFGRPGDVALALSTSGTSANVVRALETARDLGLARIVVTGPGSSPASGLATVGVEIPAATTAAVQEGTMLFLHALCEICESTLAGTAT